jgi:hypothetical protein
MSTVIETYKIQFVTRLIHNENLKLMYSISDVLDQLIIDYDTVDIINKFLLSRINDVLIGVYSKKSIVSQSMVTAEITSSITNLFQDPDAQPNDPPDFSLPTADFKEIAEAWLNYVQG